MNTSLLPLRDLARETAVEILTDCDGRRRITELLAISFLRGYSEAHRDTESAARHARVISGTGNASEQRELRQLVAGLKVSA
jgi:hypothetical protein